MLEAKVIEKVQRWAKKNGVEYIRLVFRQGAVVGWPDFLYLIEGGVPFFIEYKAKGKKPTKLQKRRIETLEKLGYDVEVHDDPVEAIAAICTLVEASRDGALVAAMCQCGMAPHTYFKK